MEFASNTTVKMIGVSEEEHFKFADSDRGKTCLLAISTPMIGYFLLIHNKFKSLNGP